MSSRESTLEYPRIRAFSNIFSQTVDPSLIPPLPSPFWPPLTPPPSVTTWVNSPRDSFSPLSPTTHKLPLVWKRCSLQTLICFSSSNIQTSSYFLIIFSALNLWDVSTSFLCSTSVLNSKRTVSWGATNGLLINEWNSLLLSPHSACLLEMSESDDQFLLKVILGHWLWRQYYPDLPFFSLSQSLLIHLPPSTSWTWYSSKCILILLPFCQL